MVPLPVEQRAKFFVFVIESPSAVDLYHRRSEGEIIRQAVELNQIPCIVRTAISLEAFDACLKIGLSDAMKAMPGSIPLLHISAHGDSNGIGLSNGYHMTWNELRSHLRPINEALNGTLIVCMSSCEGYSGTRMAMYPTDSKLPYLVLVGCVTKPVWGETAVGFATLYHQLARGEHIDTAVAAMRTASGNEGFIVEHAEVSLKGYLEYIKSVDISLISANLAEIVASEPPGEQTAQGKLRALGKP